MITPLSNLEPSQKNTLKITTYNIHKGMSPLNRKVIMADIAELLTKENSDIICMQEVQGKNSKRAHDLINFSSVPQHQLLAEYMEYNYSYGKNAIYDHGHHGNSILSRYPLKTITNLDISVNSIEKRGMLHTEVTINNTPVAVISVHLNLLEIDRNKQYKHIIDYISKNIDPNQPLIIAGDLNDWRQLSHKNLGNKLNMTEVMHHTNGKLKPTFPARLPLLSLDRIYVRNISIEKARVVVEGSSSQLSDHLPVSANLLLG